MPSTILLLEAPEDKNKVGGKGRNYYRHQKSYRHTVKSDSKNYNGNNNMLLHLQNNVMGREQGPNTKNLDIQHHSPRSSGSQNLLWTEERLKSFAPIYPRLSEEAAGIQGRLKCNQSQKRFSQMSIKEKYFISYFPFLLEVDQEKSLINEKKKQRTEKPLLLQCRTKITVYDQGKAIF